MRREGQSCENFFRHLFTLFHKETGSEELEKSFRQVKITHFYLSEITKVEFTSAVWKRVRTQSISTEYAKALLTYFESDSAKYHFVPVDHLILNLSKNLVTKYRREGLRTLDSIQLSTGVSLIKQADLFFTADKLLKTLFENEGLQTNFPNY